MAETPSKKLLILGAVLSAFVLLTFTAILRYGSSEPSGQKSVLVTADNGIVATDNANCSMVGRDILKKGGNAVDAAIASALCLGVLQNHASGIGGGGIMVIRFANGTSTALNFREWAPAKADYKMFVGNPNASMYGGKAIAVPGELRGFDIAHTRYGKLNWSLLFDDVIPLARASNVGATLAANLKMNKEIIQEQANNKFKSVYMRDGDVLQEGDILVQNDLADTLERVRDSGGSIEFYSSMASAMAKDIKNAGGIITKSDFSDYYDSGVTETPTLNTWYHGYKIIGPNPPITGGPCLQFILNILEGYNLPKRGFNADTMHYILESWKFAFADRLGLGDPNKPYNASVLDYLLSEMASKEHAAHVRKRISPDSTFPVPHYEDVVGLMQQNNEHGTSHLVVVDAEGNTVSMTSTVNGAFGSYVMASNGVLLNNQMDDFSTPNQTNMANYIEPKRKPLSTMTPTIVEKDGELYMAVGGSGGSRILTATAQVLLHVLDFGKSIAEAIDLPRLHNQLIPIETYKEVDYPEDIINALEKKNHTFILREYLSAVQGVVVGEDSKLYGASDFRKRGIASGY